MRRVWKGSERTIQETGWVKVLGESRQCALEALCGM